MTRSRAAELGPLHLTPVLVAKPWGGRRLARFGRRLPDDGLIGESWDVADLEPADVVSVADPVSRVATGPWTGRSLGEVIATDREALLGGSPDVRGRFPLLVKLLDAREHLSVQVHPPVRFVEESGDGHHLKTESWVVLDAEPGSELMIGVVDGTEPADLRRTVGTPDIVGFLRRVPAVVGEVHHLPAGTIHALGAGVLVAEVQTPSDTTFRLYDWTREYGRTPRELQVEAGLRSIELGWEHNVTPWQPPQGDPTVLVDTPEYRLLRHHVPGGGRWVTRPGRVRIVQVLTGDLDGDGLAWPLGPGGVVVLPAAWSGSLSSVGGCSVLETVP